jgi:hypothetical protein
MKFCQPHWDRLRNAIKERGIDHLGAKTGEQVIEEMKADLEGQKRPYDPLLDCHWMITCRAMELGGLYLMTQKEDGSNYCPICEVIAHGGDEDHWINGPADAALEECRKRGLVPAVS